VSDPSLMPRLKNRLAEVEDRIVTACARAGRKRWEVTLVSVTKTVGTNVAASLAELGQLHLGENRPQELWRKAEALPPWVRWHLIGHLQRNKVERTLPLAHLIHAVDSVRLLDALEQEAVRQGRVVPVLLEVNASGEASKHGFAPAEVLPLAPRLRQLQHVRVGGLMTMAAPQEPEACRPTFRLLRELRDRLRAELPAPHAVDHLSMGMSNDFEVAIEEGATLIRLGTVLFEGVVP
jgi:pyridoxal phosphate enzyme (YggS family)